MTNPTPRGLPRACVYVRVSPGTKGGDQVGVSEAHGYMGMREPRDA